MHSLCKSLDWTIICIMIVSKLSLTMVSMILVLYGLLIEIWHSQKQALSFHRIKTGDFSNFGILLWKPNRSIGSTGVWNRNTTIYKYVVYIQAWNNRVPFGAHLNSLIFVFELFPKKKINPRIVLTRAKRMNCITSGYFF